MIVAAAPRRAGLPREAGFGQRIAVRRGIAHEKTPSLAGFDG